MRLSQEAIQRMINGRSGGGGGGGSFDPSALAGYATQAWTEENYISKTFFNELFIIHKKVTTVVMDGETEISRTVTTNSIFAPNEIPGTTTETDEETGYVTTVTTEISSIESKKGFWTNYFISALGLNSEGGGGGLTLNEPLATINVSGLANHPSSSGQTIVWNGTAWVYGTAGGGTGTVTGVKVGDITYSPVNGIVSIPAYPTSLAWSAITGKPTTLAGYGITDAKIENGVITLGSNTITPLTSSAITDMATKTWVGNNYLPLTGGTVTGAITLNSGGWWSKAREHAIIRTTASNSDTYYAAFSLKTVNGDWSVGVKADTDKLYAIYTTDTEYEAGSNNPIKIMFPQISGTLAMLTDNIASATKLDDDSPYTVWGQTFFTGGKPKSISNTYMNGVTNIDSLLYFDTANNRIGVSKSSPSYAFDVNGTAQATTLRATDIYIGGVHITADNNGIHINSAGLYADTYVSALGLNDSQGVVSALSDLSDVTITSPSNGQALIYDGGIWKNGDADMNMTALTTYLASKILTIKNGTTTIGTWNPTAAGTIDIASAVSGYVTALGTNGDYLTWTKNGTANNLTVPYATHATRLAQSDLANDGDLSQFTHATDMIYAAKGGGNTVTDKPTGVDAFGVLSFKTAAGYNGQILLDAGGVLYVRSSNSLSGVAWKKILYSANTYVTNGKGYINGTEITTISGNAATASRLIGAGTYTLWGQTYWSGGVPQSVIGDIRMLPSGGNAASDSAKIDFRTLANNNEYVYGPYIQAININTYGRKRLSVFQKNDADWTTAQTEVFTIMPNGTVGIATSTPNTNYKLDVAGYAKAGRLYLSDSIYMVVENNGVHIVGGGLYADTYVSALGLSDSGGSAFDETSMWIALGTTITAKNIALAYIQNAADTRYALKTDIPTLSTLSWSYGSVTSASGSSYNGNAARSFVIPKATSHLTNDSGFITSSSLDAYLPLTGGTLTGSLRINGTSHQNLVISSSAVTSNVAWTGVQFQHVVNDTNVAYGGIRMDEQNGSFFRYNSSYTTYKMWDEGNDGTSSGLDADLLDGQHASYFATAANMTTANGKITTLESYFTNGVANNADKLDGKHLNELFTALTSTNDTNLSVTVGGVTKTISGLYALRMKGVRVLEDNTYGDLNLLDGTSYSVITNYNSNDRWLNAPNVSGYWGGAVVFRGEDASLMGQLMWNARHDEDNFPTRYLWWRARANTGWKNDWRSIALGDTDGNIYMLTSASGTNINSNSAKLKFNSFYIDGFDVTVGQTVVEGSYRSPYIQAIYENSYGRKRLSVFQSNATNYTDPFNEVFTILPNGTVGINPPVTGANTNYNLDVNGYTKTFRLYLSDTIYLTVENGGVHVVGGGLYADTYVSALGLSDSGGSAFDETAMWIALGTTISEKQISSTYLTNALAPYALKTDIPTLRNLSWSYGSVTSASGNSYNGGTARSFVIPKNTSHLTNDSGFITSSALGAYVPLAGGVMTGVLTTPKIRINTLHNSGNTNGGIYYYNGTTDYLLIGQGSSNLWIGANETVGTHHTGSTYISSGDGETYISRLVSGTRSNYKVLDVGNTYTSGGKGYINGSEITTVSGYAGYTQNLRSISMAEGDDYDTLSGYTYERGSFVALNWLSDAQTANITLDGKTNRYITLLSLGYNNRTIQFMGFGWSDTLKYRHVYTDANSNYVLSPWKTIAFTDSTVEGAKKLQNWYTSRPTSADVEFGDGALRTFKATGTMTTGRPDHDAHILHMAWDNNGGYDAEVAVLTSGDGIKFRGQSAHTWTAWKTLLDTSNYVTYAKPRIPVARKNLSAAGWYRVVDVKQYGMSFLLTLYGNYNNQSSATPVTFLISHGYNNDSIVQVGGCADTGQVNQVRIVRYGSGQIYIDVYYGLSVSNGVGAEITPLDEKGTWGSTCFVVMNFASVSATPASGQTIVDSRYISKSGIAGLYITGMDGYKQNPDFFGRSSVGFLMSNQAVNGDTSWKNWMYMDNYYGTDAGGTTAIGVSRSSGRMFVMRSDSSRTSWNTLREVVVADTTGNVGIGYGNTAASYKLDVNGAARVKDLWIGSIHITEDSVNGGIHIANGGMSANTYVSALGVGEQGGGSQGLDIEAMWTELGTPNSSRQIDSTHISVALNGYATQNWVTSTALSGYATQNWVNQQGFIKNAGVTSVVLSVPTGLRVNSSTSATITSTGTFAITLQSGYSIPTSDKQASWDAKQNAISDIATIRSNATNGETAYEWINTSRTKNTVLAAPNGSSGKATFRTLVSDDIPNLAASKITSGTFSVDRIPVLTVSKIPDLSNTYATASRVTTLEGYFTSGSANTAVKLKTARTINGTSFDGTANITTSTWGTSRNISISDADNTNTGTSVSVNGSDAVTLLLPSTIKASISGNATTATTASKLSTVSKTVWGQTYWTSGGVPTNVSGSIDAGGNGGVIAGFHSIELNNYGTLSGYGGFIDFHYNGSSADYTSRIIENAAGTLAFVCNYSYYPRYEFGLGDRTSMQVGSYDGSYVQIGDIRLVYDEDNNAIKIETSTGGAANLYALGGISALGMSSDASSSISSSLVPSSSGEYDLGSTSYKWRNLYLYNGGAFSIVPGSSAISLNSNKKIVFTSDIEINDESSLYVDNRICIGSSNSSYAFYVSGNSYLTGSISASNVINRSDMRLKDFVKNTDLRVESIAEAPSFKFTFKDGDGRLQVGTSAQYWRGALPESVLSDADGMLGLDYGVTALVSVISVARKVMTHEERIKALEKENERLRNEIETLKAA